MKISEYIQKLVALAAEHGDLEVVDTNDDPIGEPEEVEGSIVLCETA